jgi:hypothetical protein
MEIVAAISGGSVGSIGVVGENAIDSGVDGAATAGGQTTDIIADKLLSICVTVENCVEKEVANGVLLECIVVRSGCVRRGTLLVDDAKSGTRTRSICGSKQTVSHGVE